MTISLTDDQRTLLFSLLEEQIGVIAKIDTHHDAGLMGARSGHHKFLLRREAEVLMAKHSAACCRQLLVLLTHPDLASTSLASLMTVLHKAVEARVDHPFAASAKRNLEAMVEVLSEAQHPSTRV